MPVVPSDHGLVHVYTRSPWASSAKRSSATAPLTVPYQALQLIPSMGLHLGVGVQPTPVDTGTAGARACGECPSIPKARSNTAHGLSGPLATGDALCDGGCHGTGALGLVIA